VGIEVCVPFGLGITVSTGINGISRIVSPVWSIFTFRNGISSLKIRGKKKKKKINMTSNLDPSFNTSIFPVVKIQPAAMIHRGQT
jgi:hypothetical protein